MKITTNLTTTTTTTKILIDPVHEKELNDVCRNINSFIVEDKYQLRQLWVVIVVIIILLF